MTITGFMIITAIEVSQKKYRKRRTNPRNILLTEQLFTYCKKWVKHKIHFIKEEKKFELKQQIASLYIKIALYVCITTTYIFSYILMWRRSTENAAHSFFCWRWSRSRKRKYFANRSPTICKLFFPSIYCSRSSSISSKKKINVKN